MQENRQHPRKSIDLPAGFQREGGERVAASCRDISLGGAFLETAEPAPYGSTVKVFLMLPGLREEAALAATVRWVKKGEGMGVQFGVMGARETHAIIQFIQHG
ncbi:MAG: PilZ domain-containing protein [Polyangiaceae bacterium]|nr:PilZ domain-containing protein [Polyangiaceae bacterium]